MFIRFDTKPACDGQTDKNAVGKTALSVDAGYNNGNHIQPYRALGRDITSQY